MHEGCKGHGVQTNRKNGAVGARQNPTWRALKPDSAGATSRVGVPTLQLGPAKCQVGAPTLSWLPKSWFRPKKPTYCDITTKQRNHKLQNIDSSPRFMHKA